MNEHVIPPHRLICVDPARMAEVWPIVRDMLDEGYAAVGEITPSDLLQWLAAGKGQLWLSIEGEKIVAALTTSIVPKRRDVVLRMVCCGGSNMDLWLACHQQIEEFARDNGCARVTCEGRLGWSRALGGGGYKVTRVTIEKRL